MPSTTAIATALATTVFAASVDALPSFLSLIPGSQNVPGVEAIGHVLSGGGGDRNAFGQDFDDAGKQWNEALCFKDSDGDGQHNGAELGDPCCEWKPKTNEKLVYMNATAPGDATSKQDPKIWASIKCADGQTPDIKAAAYGKITVTPPMKQDNTTMAPLPSATTAAPAKSGAVKMQSAIVAIGSAIVALAVVNL